MKKKSLNFIVPLVVYPFDVMVSFGESDQAVLSALKKGGVDIIDLDIIKLSGVGRYCIFENNASLIRLANIPSSCDDYATLAHEVFHAVTYILDRVGMSFELKTSDEAYSYLIGYLTGAIYKKINHA